MSVQRLVPALLLIWTAPTASLTAQETQRQTDWAGLQRYRQANAELRAPTETENRVVFYGNSITEGWARYFSDMFPGKAYIGRGIGGQTTPQMLVRFRQDVIALRPKVVVILAGTNDIAGNTGPSTLEMIEDNLASMVELAKANRIRVVLSSVLPVYNYPWRPGLEPADKIIALNRWMEDYARRHGVVYLDYHSAMVDARGGLRSDLSSDGVHPNEAGYRVMAPLAERAIRRALRQAGFRTDLADSRLRRLFLEPRILFTLPAPCRPAEEDNFLEVYAVHDRADDEQYAAEEHADRRIAPGIAADQRACHAQSTHGHQRLPSLVR